MTAKMICNTKAREAYWSKATAVGDEYWLLNEVAEVQNKRLKIHGENGAKYLSGKKWH